MNSLFLLLLFPLAWPFIAKRIWHSSINYQEMGLSIVIAAIVVAGTWQAGKWSALSDTEVWNGQVTTKKIEDGYYQTSYCCSTDKDGNCTQTCYDDHYTRAWNAYTTVGKVTFDSIDVGSRSRRDGTPPPRRYNVCKPGEPASIEHSYTNYVQAVPQSLFHDDSKTAEQFAGKIPAYPRVYDFYRINRVINVDSKVSQSDINALNVELNKRLISLGASKQANIVVILTEIDDPNYRYAVENAWLGGEKNDIVVFVGLDGNKITWADVMTWALNSGNEMFHVTMRDNIIAMKEFNIVSMAAMTKIITNLYDRPHMADYEYLAEEVTPPTWVIYLAVFLSFGVPIGLTVLFHFKEVDFLGHRGYSRRRFNNRRY